MAKQRPSDHEIESAWIRFRIDELMREQGMTHVAAGVKASNELAAAWTRAPDLLLHDMLEKPTKALNELATRLAELGYTVRRVQLDAPGSILLAGPVTIMTPVGVVQLEHVGQPRKPEAIAAWRETYDTALCAMLPERADDVDLYVLHVRAKELARMAHGFVPEGVLP